MKKYTLYLIALCFINQVMAGEADVIKVDISNKGDNRYTFNVTLLHADSGWDHYANKWEIQREDGSIIAVRKLLHPHVNEQPFTRSLSRVKIPADVKVVTICAHDLVHKYGGKTITVELPEK
jgi:hypothetical protein